VRIGGPEHPITQEEELLVEQQMLTALVAQEGSGGQPGQAQPGQGQQTPGCQGMGGMLVPILLMFVVIYFLMIRPQQKQQKKHRAMLGALKKGDKIITNAGIFGTITGMTDVTATLEIAKNVHIRVLRGQIAGLQPEAGDKSSDGAAVVPNEGK
jgi:preprotein translocase subunit YajC